MIGRVGRSGDHETWAPVSDLMAALMLIFMFIAVVYIRSVVDEQAVNRVECKKIYDKLDREFQADFEGWDVALLPDLTVLFRNPDLLFDSQSPVIKTSFESVLADFFPRYIEIIKSLPDRENLEVIIEGHTSRAWEGVRSEDEKYVRNMELSHDRTLSILRFVLNLPGGDRYRDSVKITATGLSSSDPIEYPGTEEEDPERSRRVEFRLVADSCQRAGL